MHDVIDAAHVSTTDVIDAARVSTTTAVATRPHLWLACVSNPNPPFHVTVNVATQIERWPLEVV